MQCLDAIEQFGPDQALKMFPAMLREPRLLLRQWLFIKDQVRTRYEDLVQCSQCGAWRWIKGEAAKQLIDRQGRGTALRALGGRAREQTPLPLLCSRAGACWTRM